MGGDDRAIGGEQILRHLVLGDAGVGFLDGGHQHGCAVCQGIGRGAGHDLHFTGAGADQAVGQEGAAEFAGGGGGDRRQVEIVGVGQGDFMGWGGFAEGEDAGGGGIRHAVVAPGGADVVGDRGDLMIGQDRAEGGHDGAVGVPGDHAAEHDADGVVGRAAGDGLVAGEVREHLGDALAIGLVAGGAVGGVERVTFGELGGGDRHGFDGVGARLGGGLQIGREVVDVGDGELAQAVVDHRFHRAERRAVHHVAALVQIGDQIGPVPGADAVLPGGGDVGCVPGFAEDLRAGQRVARFDREQQVARRVAFGAVAERFGDIGAVADRRAPGFLVMDRVGAEEQDAPAEQDGADVEGEIQGVGDVRGIDRRNRIEIGFDRQHVRLREFRIGGVGHRRVDVFREHQQRVAGRDAVMQGVPELLVGPVADAVGFVGRDVGGIHRAERRDEGEAAGEGLGAGGFVAGHAIGRGGEVFAALHDGDLLRAHAGGVGFRHGGKGAGRADFGGGQIGLADIAQRHARPYREGSHREYTGGNPHRQSRPRP